MQQEMAYSALNGDIMVRRGVDFKNNFSLADVTSEEPVFIELPRNLKSDGGQYDIVPRLKKSIFGQAKASHLWCEMLCG